jgi:hypothetical protein
MKQLKKDKKNYIKVYTKQVLQKVSRRAQSLRERIQDSDEGGQEKSRTTRG